MLDWSSGKHWTALHLQTAQRLGWLTVDQAASRKGKQNYVKLLSRDSQFLPSSLKKSSEEFDPWLMNVDEC